MKKHSHEASKTERIAKRLARAGVCSRRDAERLIQANRVTVDGVVISSPALNVAANHLICVDGKPIQTPEPTRLFCYHKPAGTLTSARDPKGRPTIFDKLPKTMPRVVSIGRLDFNTEGLLLLTNDGELARYMELPQQAFKRRYRVRVHGKLDQNQLALLANGITIDGIHYQPIHVEIEKNKAIGTNQWLIVTICEGKNREIRKIMAHLKLEVTRLIRIEFGPFSLGKLAKNSVQEVPQHQLRNLLNLDD